MGDGRAGDSPVGRVAMMMRLTAAFGRWAALALLLPVVLQGCSPAVTNTVANSAGPISGAAVGLGLGGITANPLIGYAAGIGTQAAVSALQKYLSRKFHQGEQDNIAAAVGRMQPGQTAAWKISYEIPVGSEHGDVTVTRLITNPLTTCKEAAFTVIAGKEPDAPRGIYVTTACLQPDGQWKWAEAEPAVSRWGFLQ